ncbi:MAG TPA: FixH family protein [Anaerolineae bacterium]|nr:FixH family protein [Anaerolineae bacterium]
MRNSLIVITLMLGAIIALAGCGQPVPTLGAPTVTPTAPPPTPTANIAVATIPDPPAQGQVEIIVIVTDKDGEPINDAVVFVFADHTAMSGMGVTGPATKQGDGRYVFKANFGMSGDWKFTVQVKKPPLDISKQVRLLSK